MFLALVMAAAGERWLCASGLRVHDAVRCSWRTFKGSFNAVWAVLQFQARQREVFRVFRVLRALTGKPPGGPRGGERAFAPGEVLRAPLLARSAAAQVTREAQADRPASACDMRVDLLGRLRTG